MTWGYAPGMHPLGQGSAGFGTPTYQPQKPSAFQGALDTYMSYNAPQFASYNMQNAGAVRNAAYGAQGTALDQQGLQNSYAANLGDANTAIGLNQIDLRTAMRQPGVIDQLLASQNRDFDISALGLGTAYRKDNRDLNSDATARGAFGASNVNKDRTTLFEQLGQSMGHLNESRTQNTVNQTENKAQAQDRIDALNTTAQNLAMKPDQLRAALDNGLAKAGLSGAINTDNLLDGIAQNNLQAQQLLYQIIQQAGQYATARGAK